MQTSLIKNISALTFVTAALLLIPLIAMQFTTEVNWNWFDFAVMGTLIFGTGLTYLFLSRISTTTTHRVVLAVLLLAAFVLTWAELAVGIFGTPFAGT